MNLPSGRLRRILGGSAAAAVLMGGGIGIGVALTGGASAAAGNTAAPAPHARHACARASTGQPRAWARCARVHRLRLLGGVHGQVTFKARTGFRTFAFERGSVQSVSGSTLTVRAADGTTWTWHLVNGSVIREDHGTVAASRLSAGEQVLVAGPVVNGGNDAKLVRIRP